MKTIFWGSLVAGWLILAVGEVRGVPMQVSGAYGSQQFNASRVIYAQAPVSMGPASVFQGQRASPIQFAQPGHSTVHSGQFSNQRHGDFHSAPVFVQRTSFNHNHFGQCRRSILVFVNGSPFWYSAYTAYPYYYGVPPTLDTSSAVYTTDNDGMSSADSSATNPGTAQPVSNYSDLGTSWGQDLRRDVASWDQFVGYLKAYIITAPPENQAEFREAFINAYRINGAAAYDKAAVEAAGEPAPSDAGPKIITMPQPSE